MVIKDKFELVYGRQGDIPNIMPLRSSRLVSYKIDSKDLEHLKLLTSIYARSKGSEKYVMDNINKVNIVRMEDYPLPGFVNIDKKPYINLSVLPNVFISDITPGDVYALYTYSISLASFYNQNRPFEKSIEEHISNYIIMLFINLYAKKHGLMGSYKHLIPQMQTIIASYVHCGMFGNPVLKSNINKIASRYFANADDLDLSDDISTTVGFIRALRKNNIIPISENLFTTAIINRFGLTSLPLFEDVGRFFATLLTSNLGSSIVSKNFKGINRNMFDRLHFMGLRSAKKGKL